MIWRFVAGASMLFAAAAADAQTCKPSAGEEIRAAFAPWVDAEQVIVNEIESARSQVRMQAYLLTSRPIASALIAAHRRGADVEVLADGGQQAKTELSLLPLLSAAGIPVWLETKYQNAHNKIVLIDAESSAPAVVTGSFNFTWTAQHKNAENILVIHNNACLASHFLLNWKRHRQDAVPYKQ